MSSYAIRIQDVGKRFLIGQRDADATTFYEAVGSLLTAPWKRFRALSRGGDTEEFWALKEITFEVHEGEVVGLIGHNGAGKSTLLKILSRITEPTVGRIEINGRVASLLEVGTGFHPELTGRENVYLNGSILGMSRKEIAAKFDAIVEFSGIERFLDTPFKRYSSGMGVRLAFAVAAHLDPEILIIDEVLAVGDAEFQKKCLGKMSEVAGSGRTVLFVSHNMSAVENLCQRVVLLKEGRVEADGPSREVVEGYLNDLAGAAESGAELPAIRGLRARLNLRGREGELCRPGEPIVVRIELASESALSDVRVSVGIDDHRGYRLATLFTIFQSKQTVSFEREATFEARWDEVTLVPGTYRLTLTVFDGAEQRAMWENAFSLTVSPADYFGTGRMPDPVSQGCMLIPVTWTMRTD